MAADADIEAAWRRANENYSNEDLHRQFVELCFARGCPAVATERYQLVLNTRTDDPIAKKMHKEIVGKVTVQLMMNESNFVKQQQVDQKNSSGRGMSLRLMLIVGGMIAAAVYVVSRLPRMPH